MRVTRARAQQNTEESNAAEQERSPLVEISPNASPEQAAPVEELPKKTPAKGKSKKGAKKGAKGKKAKVIEEDEPIQVVLEDERQAAGSPASDAAAENLVKDVPEEDQTPVNDEHPASPPSKAVRLTRRQLAKQEEELKQTQHAQSPVQEPESTIGEITEPVIAETQPKVDLVDEEQDEEAQEEEAQEEDSAPMESQEASLEVKQPQETNVETQELESPQLLESSNVDTITTNAEPQVEESESNVVLESLETLPEPEPKTLATERPTGDTLSPVASRTPSRRRASRSPSKSPMRIEESIEALDALEEALEDVGKAVSHFDRSKDERSPRKKTFPKDVATPNTRSKTLGRTPLSQRISRTPSAAPISIKPTKSSLARASSVRVAPSKEAARKGSTETVDYLASKRRPISVSFPTPPPPPKGRAPTRPAFQLSSETVAAKLKAQKEERLKREAEREAEGVAPKQRPVSVSFVPTAKSSKPPTKANFQLPGEAVAAKLKAQREERQRREAEGAEADQPKTKARLISMPPLAIKSTKAPTKANFQLPGEAVAAKLKAQREERQRREEEADAAKKAAAASRSRPATVRKPITLPTRTQPSVTIPAPSKPESSSSSASKRNSIQPSRSASVSTTSSNRNSLHMSKSTVTLVDAAQQKLKGREVFLRDKMEKDIREHERREKEEAAKKARAEAAERGRVASREWAEKQRKKMMEAVRAKAGAA